MASFAEIFKSIDAQVISTMDTLEIDRLRVLLDRESSHRRPKDAVSCLKEWADLHPDRSVFYLVGLNKCQLGVSDEHGNEEVKVVTIEYISMPGDLNERKKMVRKVQKSSKQKLAEAMLFHIKTLFN